MSMFRNPFDPEVKLHSAGCTCSSGRGGVAEDDPPDTQEGLIDRVVESALVRGWFGHHDEARRNFLRLAGGGTLAAALGAVLPLDAVKAAAKESGGPLEKKDLKVGFIPITRATPIIIASPR